MGNNKSRIPGPTLNQNNVTTYSNQTFGYPTLVPHTQVQVQPIVSTIAPQNTIGQQLPVLNPKVPQPMGNSAENNTNFPPGTIPYPWTNWLFSKFQLQFRNSKLGKNSTRTLGGKLDLVN